MKFIVINILALLIMISCGPGQDVPFIERIQPVSKESGFRMDGYWVWDGSIIKEEDTYHLFASRWPKVGGFPSDYRKMSEIVGATSSNIVGPYEFQEVVIGERDSSFWDSNMAHNPTIHKIDDTYVLFYIGSDFTTMQSDDDNLLRRVGYATASSITGPWKRSDQPAIHEESNNPAVIKDEKGNLILMFRDTFLKIKVATAPELSGPFNIANDDVWPDCKLEDFYLFKHDGEYRMICEDNMGHVSGHERWGVQFSSRDGINWGKCRDLVVYDHDIRYTDGTVLHCTRRERPQLYIENGEVKSLITAVYDGYNSWCQPVLMDPGY